MSVLHGYVARFVGDLTAMVARAGPDPYVSVRLGSVSRRRNHSPAHACPRDSLGSLSVDPNALHHVY